MPLGEDAVFFTVAVGFTMPWVALSSELGYLKMLHGPNFLLYLNLAYFTPSLPTLILQLAYDHGCNKYFGTAVATLIRQGCAQTVCAVCCVALPFLDWKSAHTLLALTAVVGVAGSVAFGSASQLVARFPPQCGQALALGIVAAGPLVLLLQALLRIGADPSRAQQAAFFLLAALCPLAALASVSALIRRHWSELQEDKHDTEPTPLPELSLSWEAPSVDTVLLDNGDASPTAPGSVASLPVAIVSGSQQPLLTSPSGAPYSCGELPPMHEPPPPSRCIMRWPSLVQYVAEQRLLLPEPMQENWDTFSVHSMPAAAQPLLVVAPSTIRAQPTSCAVSAVVRAVAPLALSLASSVAVAVLLFPLFTVVRSSGLLGRLLPQALFVARMLPDIAGRVVARRYMPPLSLVKILAVVKFASLVPALAYLWAPRELLSDAAAVAFVAVHWLLSGLIGAWVYMLLPQALPEPSAAAHAGNIMSAAFQVSTMLGLVAVTLLEYFCHPPDVGPGGEPPPAL